MAYTGRLRRKGVPFSGFRYNYFEKGCRIKCTRQPRNVSWLVLSSLFFKEIWNNGRRSEAMNMCLRVLKESNKSRFNSYSVRNIVLIISHITLRDCRVHIFSDNLSRNSCIRKGSADFTSWNILKGGEICRLGLLKGPIGLIDEWYGFEKSRKRSVFEIACSQTVYFLFKVRRGRVIKYKPQGIYSGAPNENIVKKHLNIALLNVFQYLNGRYRHIFIPWKFFVCLDFLAESLVIRKL